MSKKIKIVCHYFTLLEMITAFAVFSVLLTGILKIYDSAYASTVYANGKGRGFENTRAVMDLISRDLECIYYSENVTAFWHWKPDSKPSGWKAYRNELLAFIASTGVQPNDDCKSGLYEVKYQLYYATKPTDEKNGWLRRSVTGDYTSKEKNKKWNIYSNFKVGYTTNEDNPVSVFTANFNSSGIYERIIPYVTDVEFTCLDKNGEILEPDKTVSTVPDACKSTEVPYSVQVTLKTLDSSSWKKWLTMFQKNDYPENEPISAKLYRLQNERISEKTVYIGNRGQYN